MAKILQDTQKGGEGKSETVWLGLAQAIGCNYVPLKHNKSVHHQPSIYWRLHNTVSATEGT